MSFCSAATMNATTHPLGVSCIFPHEKTMNETIKKNKVSGFDLIKFIVF
jgi:hypothetical protein